MALRELNQKTKRAGGTPALLSSVRALKGALLWPDLRLGALAVGHDAEALT